jgi:hypothetical protein
MLLAVTLLTGIVFFAYNFSDQVNRRLAVQNTADATAISGSTWMAKSNNIIAMNNVGQVKLMSLAPVLDALPLAAEVAIRDMDSSIELAEGLRDQLDRGVPNSVIERGTMRSSGGWREVNFLRAGLEKLEAEITPEDDPRQKYPSHYERLENLDAALDSEDEYERDDGYELRQLTYWNDGDGLLWQAAIALDELSQATADAAGMLAQANADRFGRLNDAQTAFVIPMIPTIPADRGELGDFYPSLVGSFTVNFRDRTADLSMPIWERVNRINAIDQRLDEITHRLQTIEQLLSDVVDEDTIAELTAEMRRLIDEWARLDYEKERIFRNLHHSCPGGGIVDWEYPHRLGPWARLHRWRHIIWHTTGGSSRSGGGSDPLSPPTRVPTGNSQRETIGYHTYGPYRWALDRLYSRMGVPGGHVGPVSATRFVYFHHWISNIKLAYAFGLQRPQRVKYPTEWITDYEEAREFAANPENRQKLIRTRYYRVTVKSRLRWDDADWLKPPEARNQDPPTSKTFHSYDGIEPFDSPPSSRWIIEPRQWWDVERWLSGQRNGTWTRVNNYVWRWTRQVEVAFDPDIGYPFPPVDEDDDPTNDDEVRIKYLVTWWVFGGLQVGEESPNVARLSWPEGDDIAPLLMDTTVGDYDPTIGPASDLSQALSYADSARSFAHDRGVRRSHFSYLGVAHREHASRIWRQQFQTPNPVKGPVGLAQAEVFNNKSWDLWTQDWQSQLVPVTGWDDWGGRMRDGRAEIDKAGGSLDAEKVEAMLDFLESLSPELFSAFGGT